MTLIEDQELKPLLVTVAEAARLTGISRALAYEMVSSKEWPSIKLGRARRIPVDRLQQWIKEQTAL